MSQKEYLPGVKPVMELLRDAPQAIAKVWCRQSRHDLPLIAELCQKSNIPLEILDEREFARLYGGRSHAVNQGIIARLAEKHECTVAQILHSAPAAPLPLVLALDQVQDAGNLGTLVRTGWSLGIAGMILPRHNSANLGLGAFRASAGTLVHMPVCVVANLGRSLDEAEEQDFAIIGTYCGGKDSRMVNAYNFEWPMPAVLVLGNEEKGLRPGVLKRCQYLAAIPLARRFDSLNVAQAGGILMALCARMHQLP